MLKYNHQSQFILGTVIKLKPCTLIYQRLKRSRKVIAKLEVDKRNQSSFKKLSNITNLSIIDEEFIYIVNCDIEEFLKQRHNNGVLLFPPVNNFRRFLIHQTCENFRNKYDLFTFSVGQGPFRRTVICFKNQLLDPHKYSDTNAAINFETRHKHTTPTQLKSWRSDNRRIERENFTKNNTGTVLSKRNRKMGAEATIIDASKINKYNSGEVYRPPALRNHGNEAIKQNATETEGLIRHETSLSIETNQTTSLSSPTAANTSTTPTSISCNNSPIHRNENTNINISTISPQQTPIYKPQQPQQVDEQTKQPRRQQPTRRERRPDRAVYIPRARRSQTTPPNTLTTQIQTPTQQQQQPQQTQLPALAPTTSDKSKSLNQQLPITLDDTITALVKQKPPSKTVEVGKNNSCGVFNSACNSSATTTTTVIKKKEKLNKENKESREQRREQRLLRKLSFTSTQHDLSHENVKKVNENSKNIILNKDEGYEKTNQIFFVNSQQINSSSPINDVNNFNKLNDNINNLSKVSNCDSNEELHLNKEQQQSFAKTTTIREFESLEKNQLNDTEEIVNTSTILNTFESQFLHKPAQSIEINCKSTTNNASTENNVTATNIFINNSNTNTMPKPSEKPKSNKLNQTKLPHLCIEDVASQQSSTKCDVEEQELQRASKEINRSNRRIIKQTFTSDVLQIPDDVNEENEDKPKVAEDDNKSITHAPRTTSATTTYVDSNTDDDDEEEEEQDDWENMYNDSGDCLDPKIMQELTASVGKCKIELPKMDYSAYLTKQSILNEEEFPHVLEVSNFPVEFKNQDLLMVFSQYKESGFDIKWVDDTHALAVFSSSSIAAEVLTMGHPFVVLKPLAEATVESRLKAKKCAASLQPYRPRPETCAALARRLVTGALGVRLKTAAAERENEKRVLREAKERKLLAAKQRDELWEC